MRVVPTLSNGFIDATSRKVGLACTRPTRGITTSRSAIAVSSALRVSSGARLNSSMYRKPPSCMAATSGPGTKLSAE
jgi:hypothetical protein